MSSKDERNETVLVPPVKDVSVKVFKSQAMCECLKEYGHQKNNSDKHVVGFWYTVD